MDMQIQQMSEEEREEIIKYGIKRVKVIFISYTITFLIGIILGIFLQSIIFLFCFILLRRYTGGYHAETEKRCYVISFILVLVSLLCIKLINYGSGWISILQTASLLVILFLAPVDNKNNVLDITQRRKFGFKSKMIAVLLHFTYTLFGFTGRQDIVNPVAMASLIVAGSLICGYIKNCKAIVST